MKLIVVSAKLGDQKPDFTFENFSRVSVEAMTDQPLGTHETNSLDNQPMLVAADLVMSARNCLTALTVDGENFFLLSGESGPMPDEPQRLSFRSGVLAALTALSDLLIRAAENQTPAVLPANLVKEILEDLNIKLAARENFRRDLLRIVEESLTRPDPNSITLL